MTIGSVGNSSTYSPATLQASTVGVVKTDAEKSQADNGSVNKAADTTVSISDDAKRKLAAEADTQTQAKKNADGTVEEDSSVAESFAYGALGMDHPDEVKTNSDDFYTAGQVLSAIGTVATVLLAIA
ncbi:MAG: hypothetical protein V7735_04175 [Photobacterium frigidiphilum]|uniref:hypothetical protein n=1 Tax=Photobacterium frigidiphilum TaxID=264736 RepID=UPI0030016EAF